MTSKIKKINNKKVTATLAILLSSSCLCELDAASVFTVEYTNILGSALEGGTITVATGIADGATWGDSFYGIGHLIAQHEGTVIVTVTGTASADGVYNLPAGDIAGHAVSLFSDTSMSGGNQAGADVVEVVNGLNSLTFDYDFNFTSPASLSGGEAVLSSHFVTDGTVGSASALTYNGVAATESVVTSLGVTNVPEPSSALLLGFVGMGFLCSRRIK